MIHEAQDKGIEVKMITGDHSSIARQVSGQLSMEQNILKAYKFFEQEEEVEKKDRAKQKDKLNREFMEADGFAKVTPEHKFRIIKQF